MSDSVALPIIGYARTPWTRREDAPHQPSAAPDAVGVIAIAPPYRAGLADLDSLSRIWLLFVFDRSRGWAPTVKPPRGGPKRGVLATRAPNRPTPIGLTCVELTGVDLAAGELHVRGIDLLDATPILDVKPYMPIVDAWPDAGHGWLEPFLEAGIEPRLKKPYRPPDPPSNKGGKGGFSD
jgi:tRNA-Thr(GGU) m(6)t(6)A37 methyltransferase TsaA